MKTTAGLQLARVAEFWHKPPSEYLGIKNHVRAYLFDFAAAWLLQQSNPNTASTPMAKSATMSSDFQNRPGVKEQLAAFKARDQPKNLKSQGALPVMRDHPRRLTRKSIN